MVVAARQLGHRFARQVSGIPFAKGSSSINTTVLNSSRTTNLTTNNLIYKQQVRTMTASGSLFAHMEEAPVDPILGTALAYKADTDPNKVNLGIGAYRTEAGKPYVLPIVKKAEEHILSETGNSIDKEYLGVDGLGSLKECTQKLIFGEANARFASTQCLSGTGALRVCGEFIKKHLPQVKTLYYSDPTWGNHMAIFKSAGLEVEKYPYWNAETRGFNFDAFMNHVNSAPDGSCYLIHPCAHNPTGVDPTQEQWRAIVDACKAKGHICILDSAYQGYASGDLEYDRKAIEMFVASGLELFCCQSFAKNLGLYGERIGMLHVVCNDAERAKIVLSQLKLVIRPMYSSPPCHGALLVSKILGDETYYNAWKTELKEMADRILEVRDLLKKGLEEKGTPGNWDHVVNQIGMFSFTGLTVPQSERMIEKHHIYMLKNGRISLAGLNKSNVGYVAAAMDDCVRNA